MLTYYKRYKDQISSHEITYEEALRTVLGTYRDNDMTRDMLTIPNWIDCLYSIVMIEREDADGHSYGSIPGLWNLTPCGVQYNAKGQRI